VKLSGYWADSHVKSNLKLVFKWEERLGSPSAFQKDRLCYALLHKTKHWNIIIFIMLWSSLYDGLSSYFSNNRPTLFWWEVCFSDHNKKNSWPPYMKTKWARLQHSPNNDRKPELKTDRHCLNNKKKAEWR